MDNFKTITDYIDKHGKDKYTYKSLNKDGCTIIGIKSKTKKWICTIYDNDKADKQFLKTIINKLNNN